ncbi:DNA polymerase beta superfamily protein [Steroidobacter cummioxidans]|uniref:DNA polymerase beta superfamily protein n=1 Tax=Steroidobacter cummioxidans TaxID=1803913 RepID=UPI000E31BE9A|nr:nucleotidyltransferase domain-containing protein [Steroidobacter cummioxidans]
MNSLENLRPQIENAILFECIAGSRAYGTTTSTSDEDIRGIFAVPASSYLSLVRPPDQIGDEKGNTVYYSLRRIIELLAQANPNILELLFMPQDCVLKSAPEMQQLIEHRQVFISKQCADTHAGYAMSQIKKARGQNKWVNNPRSEAPPLKEDYCHVIPWNGAGADSPPARAVPLNKLGWALAEYHAAKLEHARDTYRLYHYGQSARGVFRGEVIACESIPLADEASRFAGLLLYNEAGWRQALIDHKNYWKWRRERNEARWQQQERGELDFDAKNMMHTVRLLLSGRSLMERGEPIVRFEGEQLALLMSIRQGALMFDEIMSIAEGILEDCERLKQSADLPDVCDSNRLSELLTSITETWEARNS